MKTHPCATCAFGCRVGLHNHTWEFERTLSDGTTYWDYFFANTPSFEFLSEAMSAQ